MGYQSEYCSIMGSPIQRNPSRKTPYKRYVWGSKVGVQFFDVCHHFCQFLFFVYASHRILCVSELIFITYENSANCCSVTVVTWRHSLFLWGPFISFLSVCCLTTTFSCLTLRCSDFVCFAFVFLNLKSTDTAKRNNSLDLPLNFDKVVHQVTQAG